MATKKQVEKIATKTTTKKTAAPKVVAPKPVVEKEVVEKVETTVKVEKENTPWTHAEQILETAKKLDAKGKITGQTRNTILNPCIERYNAGERSNDLLNQIEKLKE